MAEHHMSGDIGHAVLDRGGTSGRGGSVGLVLLIAIVLIGAAAGLIGGGHSKAEPYAPGLRAVLAMVGVLMLFVLVSVLLSSSWQDLADPLILLVVDGSAAGTL